MPNLTFDGAGKLFGIDSEEQYAIQNTWEEVGITCSSESYENAHSYQAHKDFKIIHMLAKQIFSILPYYRLSISFNPHN